MSNAWASNGAMEGCIQLVKGVLCVHLAALECKLGVKLPSAHPTMAWLVEFVGDVISYKSFVICFGLPGPEVRVWV